jgi:general secretion pathway protein H
MRNSATQRGAERKTQRGFTLIELLVVVLIIGLMAATVVLSVGATSGRDSELEKESERAFALMNYVREKAELQTHEFGLYCNDGSYEFLTFDPRKSLWRRVEEDDALRNRELPAGVRMRLFVEGRPVVLKSLAELQRETEAQREKREKERVPHVMIFSNGDLTPFQLVLEREGTTRSVTMASHDDGKIQLDELKEAPR